MPKKEKPIKRIDGESRFYVIDGNKYPSVTTITGVIGKPALMFWAVNQAINHIRTRLKTYAKNPDKLKEANISEMLYGAKHRHKKELTKAGDIGSIVHEILEGAVKDHIKGKRKITKAKFKVRDKNVQNCLDAFTKWVQTVDFKPIESEMTVYSHKKKYAGTLDCIGYINGRLAVIDFKSSKGIYDENALQLSAYKYAYQEMKGVKIAEMWILRLGKTDGEFEVKKFTNYQKSMKAFMGARDIWQWKQK